MQRIPIGISSYKQLREENCYYIDKTLLIKDVLNDDALVILLPRPRRFGKTLNLSMLHYFFEKTDNIDNTKALFSGLAIEQEPEFEQHFSKYPVIFITFKSVKELGFNESFNLVKDAIAKEFIRHDYLLQSDFLNEDEKQYLKSIISFKGEYYHFTLALGRLTAFLNRHHQVKPIVLIDEYDTPIHYAWLNKYYNEMVSFMKVFLGEGLKDNDNIQRAVITGILRVSKESIFSDLNNIGVYSIIAQRYSSHFGFTEQEVKQMLVDFGIEAMYNNAKDWYNGYYFGDTVIYNPWSIINFASRRDNKFIPYWANTSSNEIIRDLIKDSPSGVRTEFLDLLKDIPVAKTIDENIVFPELKKSEQAVYSFLLFSGYLKAQSQGTNVNKESIFQLTIPNNEVKYIFRNVIMSWFNEGLSSEALTEMLKALVNGEVKLFERILNDFVVNTLSYLDTSKKNVEKTYQAFLLGMLVSISDNYEISSEKESGYGRYDIAIIPKDTSKKGIIMELKTLDELDEETKDEALAAALKQIEDRKYEIALKQRGIQQIVKLAVTFDGKRVWVKSA